MNTRTIRCTLCSGIIRIPEQVMRQDRPLLCTTCVELTKTLDHRHTLSMDLLSLEDVNTIFTRLLQVCPPTTWNCMSSHTSFSRSDRYEASYWLSCSFDSISFELLHMLASLDIHFTLQDTVTKQEVLCFWPNDSAPHGALIPLIN